MKPLTKKTYFTEKDNIYSAPCEFHEKHKSILVNQVVDMFGNGDGAGYFIQKISPKTVVGIAFDLAKARYGGYILYTAEHPFYRGNLNDKTFENAKSAYYQSQAL